MIEISYANVMNGLNKSLNMRLVCHSHKEAHYLFQRVCDLWYIPEYAQANSSNLVLVYGLDALQIQCVSISALKPDNIRGFRGVFMVHPNLMTKQKISDLFPETFQTLEQHNERYLNQWRA